jgi:imidazolonepropionase-like amidohydrolase
VVDVIEGALHPGRSVSIAGKEIVDVGPAGSAPASTRRIDAAGRFLIPGLWDAHVHSAVHSHWHFPLFIANGVTGIRNMNPGSDDAIALTQSIRRRLSSGDLPGPYMIAGGPTVDGDPPAATSPIVVRDAAEARDAVDALADAGMDFVKVYEVLGRDAYFALMARARERSIPVDGHIPFRILPEEEARYVPAQLAAHWRAMTSSSVWTTVQSELAPVPDVQLANVRLLNEAGVVILARTDVGGGGPEMLIPGLSLHEELELLVKAGLTPR